LRQRCSRLKLVVNNSRFLIVPDRHVPNLGHGFRRSARGVWRAIGKKRSVMAWCCWKPLSTHNAFGGPFIGRPTGCMWGTPEGFTGRAGGIPRPRNPPRWSSSNPYGPMPGGCCAGPGSLHLTV
jgi:hypothetical protein